MASRTVTFEFATEAARQVFDELLDAVVGVPSCEGYPAGVVAEAIAAALAGEYRRRWPAEEFAGRNWRVGQREITAATLHLAWEALPILACGRRGHHKFLQVIRAPNMSDRYARRVLDILRAHGLVIHHSNMLGWSRSSRDLLNELITAPR